MLKKTWCANAHNEDDLAGESRCTRFWFLKRVCAYNKDAYNKYLLYTYFQYTVLFPLGPCFCPIRPNDSTCVRKSFRTFGNNLRLCQVGIPNRLRTAGASSCPLALSDSEHPASVRSMRESPISDCDFYWCSSGGQDSIIIRISDHLHCADDLISPAFMPY